MWPELFGSGAELGLFVAGRALAGLGAIAWFAVRTVRPLDHDPVADLWRRYEQGDLWGLSSLGAMDPADAGAADYSRPAR